MGRRGEVIYCMAACEPERMGKHMAAYARGRQPRCMSAAACVPATCERRCAQACALPKCVPRTANTCGSCWRTGSGTHTGWPEAHTSVQASARVQADVWGGKPAAGSTAAREKRLSAKAGEGRHERRRVGGRCWHLGTGADECTGTCRCACSRCPPWHAQEASPHPWVCTHRPGAGHSPGPANSSCFLC